MRTNIVRDLRNNFSKVEARLGEAEQFLTFDTNQKRLVEAEGMIVSV